MGRVKDLGSGFQLTGLEFGHGRSVGNNLSKRRYRNLVDVEFLKSKRAWLQSRGPSREPARSTSES